MFENKIIRRIYRPIKYKIVENRIKSHKVKIVTYTHYLVMIYYFNQGLSLELNLVRPHHWNKLKLDL